MNIVEIRGAKVLDHVDAFTVRHFEIEKDDVITKIYIKSGPIGLEAVNYVNKLVGEWVNVTIAKVAWSDGDRAGSKNFLRQIEKAE